MDEAQERKWASWAKSCFYEAIAEIHYLEFLGLSGTVYLQHKDSTLLPEISEYIEHRVSVLVDLSDVMDRCVITYPEDSDFIEIAVPEKREKVDD